eukprot:gnl/MRDRNA2_/MRDRNA2_165822_c0_seq1.p1 gnl/MRDRNA2_/MRDRNA2_165822_c0~~gnl/MRDRNA2_/MRDRNA2_165822_c0_seq1.p1  ORF type:complete len:162 (-),score=27.95 gnl/MRDRNA2_/MRDRNA2_165822_c0_seq1:34-519(-)
MANEGDFWQNEIFEVLGGAAMGDHSEWEVCCQGCFCPALNYARLVEDRGRGGFSQGFVMYNIAAALCCHVCLVKSEGDEIAHKLGWRQDECFAFAKSCCCHQCYLCQVTNEMILMQRTNHMNGVKTGKAQFQQKCAERKANIAKTGAPAQQQMQSTGPATE